MMTILMMMVIDLIMVLTIMLKEASEKMNILPLHIMARKIITNNNLKNDSTDNAVMMIR